MSVADLIASIDTDYQRRAEARRDRGKTMTDQPKLTWVNRETGERFSDEPMTREEFMTAVYEQHDFEVDCRPNLEMQELGHWRVLVRAWSAFSRPTTWTGLDAVALRDAGYEVA